MEIIPAKKPWDGIGYEVTKAASPRDMLDIAGINWTVSKRQSFVPASADPNKADGSLIVANDLFALVRDSDNKVFGPCGPDFVPTQNEAALDFFTKFTKAGKMTLDSVGILMEGRLIWALASVNDASFVLPGDDRVVPYILLVQPHIWGKALIVKFTTIRPVCYNTLVAAINQKMATFRMPHVRPFDSSAIEEAEAILKRASLQAQDFATKAKLLSAIHIDLKVTERYVAEVAQQDLLTEAFGKSYARKSTIERASLLIDPSSPKMDVSQFKRAASDVLTSINSSPGADLEAARETLWGAFNGVTYAMDHISRGTPANTLHSAWFGPRSVIKTDALDMAVAMAQVGVERGIFGA